MENFSEQISHIASRYAADSIVILGKGPSADLIDSRVLASSLLIGINDAERIHPADITVLNARWVLDGLERSGYQSSLYVAPWEFDAGDATVAVRHHVSLSHDSADMMMGRMMSTDLVIEDVLFVTALHLCRIVAELRGRPQEVFMIGFDFDASLGQSERIDVEYSPPGTERRRMQISPQEHYFLHALYLLQGTDLVVSHVGHKSFSALSPEEMNTRLTATDDELELPSTHAISVVAELTTNHFGDRQRLERMVRASAGAGADFVKVQKRQVETFYTADQLASPYHSPFGETFGDYRHQLELQAEDFEFLADLCESIGIGWFVSVLDSPSYDFVRELAPAMVKLPSTVSDHRDHLEYVAKEHSGPVVVSTGMTDDRYEEYVLAAFGHCSELYLLQCTSAYPTPAEDCNLSVITHYRDLREEHPNVRPGYSSHDDGWFASALAVAAGAVMIEKHVKYGATEWAHFDAVAVDLVAGDFTEFVSRVREAEAVMGTDEKAPTPREHHKYAPPGGATATTT